jgi:hypothetical protein
VPLFFGKLNCPKLKTTSQFYNLQSTEKKDQTIMETTWLTSKETQKLLKVSGCELMHLRVSGKLKFKKQGNAYYYQVNQTKPSNNEVC